MPIIMAGSHIALPNRPIPTPTIKASILVASAIPARIMGREGQKQLFCSSFLSPSKIILVPMARSKIKAIQWS